MLPALLRGAQAVPREQAGTPSSSPALDAEHGRWHGTSLGSAGVSWPGRVPSRPRAGAAA